MSSYNDAIQKLDELVNYEHTLDQPYNADNYDLDRFRRFLADLGSPEKKIPALHIAGTKGKGSTCLIAESIIAAHGLKVGAYLSPHIESYRERIRINKKDISSGDFAAAFEQILPALDKAGKQAEGAPTHFEVLTALAFVAFRNAKVDVLVLEVGLGGRLDATNVCNPIASVITQIGLEHTAILGETIEAIAKEKAGIIRKGVPVFLSTTGDAGKVVESACMEKDAKSHCLGTDFSAGGVGKSEEPACGMRFDFKIGGFEINDCVLSVPGLHQVDNAAVAAAASQTVINSLGGNFNETMLREALKDVAIPGRVEVVREDPVIILDGAHTSDSAAALADALELHFPNRKHIFVVALLKDKSVKGVLEKFAPLAERFIVTETAHPRCLPVGETAAAARLTGVPSVAEPKPEEAFARAFSLAGDDCGVVVTGSFSLLAVARKFLRENL
ncbi:MAG: bifunctional folylpolyglutamate synthase/dihydrofolate synthase [Planctomycetota bacterium]|nr:MAG: bifunctional folylpolyglutamate synthase/dihydrofolate synthase [Planctomycetota bacterium]